MTRFFIAATVGHIDHGKSALVKALTGVDPDRLPEEKRRGITLDLGFAHLELAGPRDGDDLFSIGLIDVPGHGDLVKNMLAGLAAVDLALLVVAADEGWMPQTEEHFQILSYLLIPGIIVVLTKSDLAGPRLEQATASIRERLRGSRYADAEIIPTSTKTGEGLEQLKSALSKTLTSLPPQSDIAKPRLGIDRVFELRGIGTVVTGTLTGGSLAVGQEVALQPGGGRARIRALQSYGREVSHAGPGMRVALNLVPTDAAGNRHLVLRRGTVVTLDGLGEPTSILHVWVERSSRRGPACAFAGLRHGLRVSVHLGTNMTPARIVFGQPLPLLAGADCAAELRFETPVFAVAGDRFIIRDWSERWTIAGGIVLDPQQAPGTFKSPAQQEFLRLAKHGFASASEAVTAVVQRDRALRKNGLLLKSRYSAVEIGQALATAEASHALVVGRDWVAHNQTWNLLLANAAKLVRAHHQQHPNESGIARARLVSLIANDTPVREMGDAAIDALLADGFVQKDGLLRDKTHSSSLSKEYQGAAADIRRTLKSKALDPPPRSLLACDQAHREALVHLLATGELVSLTSELVLETSVLHRAKDAIIQLLRARGSCSVSEARDALASSRKIVVPLLEYLDRTGVTRREADKRVLRQK